MTDLSTGSLPATEPAAGKMSLREAVRAGVNSLPKFNGGQASSAATDDLASVEPGESAAPARATPEPASNVPDLPDAGDESAVNPRPVEGHTDEQASSDSLAAPSRWPEDRRNAFNALPDEAKRIVLEREKEFNAGLTQNAQKNADSVRKLDGINSLFQDHHRREMQAAGYDEAQAIKELLTRHDAFNRDPVEYGAAVARQLGRGNPALYIAELIKRTGVTQEQLFGGQQPTQQPQGQADPVDDWEDPTIVEMKQRLDRYEQFIQEQQAERQTQAQGAFQHAVSQFENAQNEDGSPKYPHIGSVTQDIISLVQNDPELHRNPAKVLEAAYNKAIRFHPEVSKQLMEEEFSRRLAAREAEAAAAKAKRAAPAIPSPGSVGGTVNRGKMSLKDAVRTAVAKHVAS
jgi:hypothetical protein